MDKHPVFRKIWCANAWVGAPWACGDDHHHSQENFEVDALDMYKNNTIENDSVTLTCPKSGTNDYTATDDCGAISGNCAAYAEQNNNNNEWHPCAYDSSSGNCRALGSTCVQTG